MRSADVLKRASGNASILGRASILLFWLIAAHRHPELDSGSIGEGIDGG